LEAALMAAGGLPALRYARLGPKAEARN